MAQGDFTKENAQLAIECVNAILNAVPQSKKMSLIGEMNDLFLFLEKAKRVAPNECNGGK